MKKLSVLFLSIFVLVLTSCSDDDDANVNSVIDYTAQLSSLNNSGASGTARVSVDGNKLTVSVEAQGMVANMPHPQHIHGLEDGTQNGTCPPASADTDNDGIITVPEGAPFYGAILLPLEDFPSADANGNVSFQKIFTLGEGDIPTAQELESLENRVIVLHGLNNNGEYVPTIPVACGELSRN